VPQGVTLVHMGMSLTSENELRTPCVDQSHTLFMRSVAHHTFIQPDKHGLEGIPASLWIITKTKKNRFRGTGGCLGVDHTPLLPSHGWAYIDGHGSYLFQTGITSNFPGSRGLYPGSIGRYGPETSDSVGGFSSCPD
jgi:hypothetical protein